MGEPLKLEWPVLFGKLVEAVTDVGADEEINFLRLTECEKEDSDDWTDHLFCDCTAMTIIDKFGETIAVVPLHQIASVGLLPSKNILSVRIGDVNLSKDLFDLLIIYIPNEMIAKEICQYFVNCFQFIYREAISEFEKEKVDEEDDFLVEQQNLDLEKKFLPSTLISSSSTSASLCSSPISSIFQQQIKTTTNCLKIEEENINLNKNNYLITNSTTTNSSLSSSSNLSTINICGNGSYVELINEYLTDLSTSLSHDELNKFAILMRRWRSREMPIVEFAQKLLELYGPERRHLLAKMRTLLRGDPTEIEALGNFLRANGVVESASAAVSPTTKINSTTKIIFCEEKNILKSCPQSSTTITNSL